MDLKPIRTEEDYQVALREASAYFDHLPAAASVPAAGFEILLMLLDDYERKLYQIAPPDTPKATT